MKNFVLGKEGTIFDYHNIIQNEQVEDYVLSACLCTTFGLEQDVLTQLLMELGSLPIINQRCVDVFYDAQSFRRKESDYSILPEECIHGVSIFENDKGAAFHPKVILLRYEGKEKEENKIRYVLLVTSKNITASKCLDTFCVVSGYVQDCGVGSAPKNGTKLCRWIKELYKLERRNEAGDRKNMKYYVDELAQVEFSGNGIESVEFLAEEEIEETFKSMEDIVVVSPFVSDNVVASGNIRQLVSCRDALAKLSPKTWTGLKDKAYVFADEFSEEAASYHMVHAKIYCGRKDDKTKLILGSSNATVSGMAWKIGNERPKPANMEFNVMLTLGKDACEAFQTSLSDYIVKITQQEKPEQPESLDKNLFGKFIGCLEQISVKKNKEGWNVELKVKNLPFDWIVQVFENRAGEIDEKSGSVLGHTFKNAVEALWIGLRQNGKEQKYCLRVAPYITDPDYLKELEQQHLDDYNRIILMKINSNWRGLKHFSIGEKKQNEGSATPVRNSTISKSYVYERLKALAVLEQRRSEKSEDIRTNYVNRIKGMYDEMCLLTGTVEPEIEEMKKVFEELLKEK